MLDFLFPFLGSIALALYGFSCLREKYYILSSGIYYSKGWNKKCPPEVLDLVFDFIWISLLCFLALKNGWYFLGLLLIFFVIKKLRWTKPVWWPYFSFLEILIPVAFVFLGFGFMVRQLAMIPSFGSDSSIVFFLTDGRWFIVLAMIAIGFALTFLFPTLGIVSLLGVGLALAGVLSFNGAIGILMGETLANQCKRGVDRNWLWAHLAVTFIIFILSDFYLILIDLICGPKMEGGKNLFSLGIRLFCAYTIFRIAGVSASFTLKHFRPNK